MKEKKKGGKFLFKSAGRIMAGRQPVSKCGGAATKEHRVTRRNCRQSIDRRLIDSITSGGVVLPI